MATIRSAIIAILLGALGLLGGCGSIGVNTPMSSQAAWGFTLTTSLFATDAECVVVAKEAGWAASSSCQAGANEARAQLEQQAIYDRQDAAQQAYHLAYQAMVYDPVANRVVSGKNCRQYGDVLLRQRCYVGQADGYANAIRQKFEIYDANQRAHRARGASGAIGEVLPR